MSSSQDRDYLGDLLSKTSHLKQRMIVDLAMVAVIVGSMQLVSFAAEYRPTGDKDDISLVRQTIENSGANKGEDVLNNRPEC